MQDNEKVQKVLTWLGREGLQIRQTLNDEEKEKCKTIMGLFKVLSELFKSQHIETVLPLQYCKLLGEPSDDAAEWIGCLRVKANECEYKEKDRRLKEQFINGINNYDMMKLYKR